jgi:ABC-type antimicrobial peptide transport system permease subunit
VTRRVSSGGLLRRRAAAVHRQAEVQDQPKLDAAILTSFAGAALTLASIGLYSLFMLIVSDRTREIAVRLAIGASPAER